MAKDLVLQRKKIEGIRDETIRNYKKMFHHFQYFFDEDEDIRNVTEGDAEDFVYYLIEQGGIQAVDPNDPNRVVVYNSAGLGISSDGGATFTEAITADGFVLSDSAIGQLAANHIRVGADTTYEADDYDPSVANQKADDANNQLDVWKYPNTTDIDGGSIRTNTIDVNSLVAGVLTGFTIQTDPSSLNPRIEMNEAEFMARDENSRVLIKPDTWNSASIQLSSDYTGHDSHNEGFFFELVDGGKNPSIYSNVSSNPLIIWGGSQVEIRNDIQIDSLDVTGSKNAAVETSQGKVRISAYETAEYYFGDICRGEVVDGECLIEIESLFKETVNIDIQYEVFLTPYGYGNIYVDPNTMTNNSQR